MEIEAGTDLELAVDRLREALGMVFAAGIAECSKERGELVLTGLQQRTMHARFVITIGAELKVTVSAVRGEEVISLFEVEGPPQRFLWATKAADAGGPDPHSGN
jgi:hypothetical protein